MVSFVYEKLIWGGGYFRDAVNTVAGVGEQTGHYVEQNQEESENVQV